MNRVRDWQVVYMARDGQRLESTHSTRELAVDRLVTELHMSAVLLWLSKSPVDHQKGDHALRMATAVQDTAEGNYMAVTHSGGQWLILEV